MTNLHAAEKGPIKQRWPPGMCATEKSPKLSGVEPDSWTVGFDGKWQGVKNPSIPVAFFIASPWLSAFLWISSG